MTSLKQRYKPPLLHTGSPGTASLTALEPNVWELALSNWVLSIWQHLLAMPPTQGYVCMILSWVLKRKAHKCT